MTTPVEEEEIDDNYEDEEIIDINDYIQIIETPYNLNIENKKPNLPKRTYICECKKCLEFIPDSTNKCCIDCGCDLIYHLTDESLYEQSDFEEYDDDSL